MSLIDHLRSCQAKIARLEAERSTFADEAAALRIEATEFRPHLPITQQSSVDEDATILMDAEATLATAAQAVEARTRDLDQEMALLARRESQVSASLVLSQERLQAASAAVAAFQQQLHVRRLP